MVVGYAKNGLCNEAMKLMYRMESEGSALINMYSKCGFVDDAIEVFDSMPEKNLVSWKAMVVEYAKNGLCNEAMKLMYRMESEGFKGSSLEKLFKPSIHFSSTRLENNVRYLRGLLGFDDTKVFKVVSKSWWLLASDYEKKISENILVLSKYGWSSHKIEWLLLKNPGCLLQRVEWLDGVVQKVEPLLGIRPDSPRFLDGVEILMALSEATLDKKLMIFRSFGWTEEEIVRMTRSLPLCLRRSEGAIKASLEWFKVEIGYGGEYLSTHPKLLVYSLEKRVVPRYRVWASLLESDLKSGFLVCTIVALSEEKFMKDFVLPYREVVPCLYENYINATGYGGEYLSTHPKFLEYSLEKRIVPRYQVLASLKENNVLKSKLSLYTAVGLSEEKFMNDFVLPYCEVVPCLYESYTNATRQKLKC
nr:transcription termination factor MTEF1, chloroplastic-like isoform X1 [Tanacetum cinerariifolium]